MSPTQSYFCRGPPLPPQLQLQEIQPQCPITTTTRGGQAPASRYQLGFTLEFHPTSPNTETVAPLGCGEGGSLPVCGDHCTSVCGGHCVPQAQPQCLSGGRGGGKEPHIYKYHLFWVMQGGEEGVITPVPRHHHSSSLGGHNPGPQIQGQPHDPPLPFLPIPS